MRKIILILLSIVLLSGCENNKTQNSANLEIISPNIEISQTESTTTFGTDNDNISVDESVYYQPCVYLSNSENKLVRLNYQEYADMDKNNINCIMIIPVFKLTAHHNEEIEKCIFEYINSLGLDLNCLKETDFISIEYEMITAKVSEIKFNINGQYKIFDMAKPLDIS